MDEAATKEELRPVKKQLKQLKLSGGDMPRDDKVAILKESLAAIGRRIEAILIAKRDAGEDVERWRRHLWAYVVPCFCFIINAKISAFLRSFVTLFWPKKVKASKLEEIHAKMVQKEVNNRPSAEPTSKVSSKSKRPPINGKSSGSGTPITANGKAHRP
jgi:chromodomain-helicase-DNA-binding protein 1